MHEIPAPDIASLLEQGVEIRPLPDDMGVRRIDLINPRIDHAGIEVELLLYPSAIEKEPVETEK